MDNGRREFLTTVLGWLLAAPVAGCAASRTVVKQERALGIPSPSGSLLGGYSELLGQPLDSPFAHSTSFEQWKAEKRQTLVELLAAPVIEPPAFRSLGVSVHGGVRIEELAWKLPFGPETHAVLLMPTRKRGRLPAVLALHDHGGAKFFGWQKIADNRVTAHPFIIDYQDRFYGGRAWAFDLARRGYAVLAHDVFPFGSRGLRPVDLLSFARDGLSPGLLGVPLPASTSGASPVTLEQIAEYDSWAKRYEEVIARSLFARGTTWPGVVLAEDRAALDILAHHPAIDAQRLGCGGFSGGGIRANYLAAVDERIRCSVTAGFMSTWSDFANRVGHIHTWMLYPPLLAAQLDYPEILGLHAPLAALVIAATDDALFTLRDVQNAELILREIYLRAAAQDRLRFRYYPGAHVFSRAMQEETFRWFDRWL